MTKKQPIKRLDKLAESDDWEMAHSGADEILTQFLVGLGHQDVVEVYDKVNKWYA